MGKKDILYLAGIVLVAALLLANLLKPEVPYAAFELPEGSTGGVSISAVGDSAWALVGNRVYYLSLKTRGELKDRIIYLIDDEELK